MCSLLVSTVSLHEDDLVSGAAALDSLDDEPDDQSSAADTAESSTDDEDPNNGTKAVKGSARFFNLAVSGNAAVRIAIFIFGAGFTVCGGADSGKKGGETENKLGVHFELV